MINCKKGNLLTENIIYIIFTLAFLIVMILFIFSKTGTAPLLEEKYAKEIALMIDSAEPGMTIDLKMQDALDAAKKENFPLSDAVKINGNLVTVKLREKGGYSYSFFNDVEVNANLAEDKETYYFVITENG